jgi:glycine/D-amino acid oxidase-like deaminating enzyme
MESDRTKVHRRTELRQSSENEIKATTVVAFTLNSFSMANKSHMSLWWSSLVHPEFKPGEVHRTWDVVIVGGGFSGLWTAHHLKEWEPTLRIAILEKNLTGSGASGRNGGWVSALYPIADSKMLKQASPQSIHNLHVHLRKTIDDIGRFVAAEGVDCSYVKGGTLVIARNEGQLKRLASQIDADHTFLNASETKARINISGALGSTFTPHCAAINPAALVIGLARSLEKRGVSIFENTEAEISADKYVSVGGSRLDTNFVVRATEAYHEGTSDQVPIYSLMIATEPLPSEVFDEIGIRNRETFAEASHLVTYAQRTSDNRLAIGGRGTPYTWGSRRNDASEDNKRGHERLSSMAREWFPALQRFEFTHAWGGAVGVTRDWAPYVRTKENYGELGGYAGDGVAISYLAAGAMADLILDKKSERVQLPFVQWKNPHWEPEPLRWIAINGAIRLSGFADREERRTNRPSGIMKFLSTITGQ